MMHRALYVFFTLVLLSGCSDGTERRLQLEELERQNRAGSLMTNDSLARDLALWFDRHGTPNEQMRAHYILGRTYADRGEMPQALNAYTKIYSLLEISPNPIGKVKSQVHPKAPPKNPPPENQGDT